ncbi:hypothetical protein [Oleidesulfovibrio sp.]|uniref:hypothetical protein n=1 Tax=Oleidesulfovibrio sp. TaxID=2909707 RepID=UPI003A8BEC01
MKVYAFFHLNIMFSSIPEAARPEVIERCYTPLLDMVEEAHFPIGIEATGYTLETIHRLAPHWIKRLSALIHTGACEFIGSGYAQIIGPLTPANVNARNFALGNDVYRRLLGIQPETALVNEQAYSAGLVPLYLDAGYSTIIMEWENAAQAHPEWPLQTKGTPQRASGTDGRSINIIWNHSLPFQQFQRVVHDEVSLSSYLEYLHTASSSVSALCVYGNDAEIFDFRPGRFHSEPSISARSEWQTIRTVFDAIRTLPEVETVLPSEALSELPGSPQPLCLESAAQPVPVKKQAKYNLVRWGVTGRDDLGANTLCRRLADHFAQSGVPDEDWQELVFLYSSDFRTHIVHDRWQEFRSRLIALYTKHLSLPEASGMAASCTNEQLRVPAEEKLILLETDHVRILLNRNRGLAIDRLSFCKNGSFAPPLLGTLPHGYFHDISLGADFYSGHMTFEQPGHPKITDLVPVNPVVTETENEIVITCTVGCNPVLLQKSISISKAEACVTLQYQFYAPVPAGSLRLGYITLIPSSYRAESLQYTTHNGGREPETFTLNEPVTHGKAISFLVSSSHACGMTEGTAALGDATRGVRLALTDASAAVMCLVTHQKATPGNFTRLKFSMQEMDDTSVIGNEADKILAAPAFGISIRPL